jgi:hypothetical protein
MRQRGEMLYIFTAISPLRFLGFLPPQWSREELHYRRIETVIMHECPEGVPPSEA